MKRRILTLLLTLVMVLSLLPGTALAVNDSSAPAVTYADLADINGTALVPDGAGENTELTVADAVRALLLWTGMTEQQLGSFPDDYLAQARSMGMIDADTDADAPCTLAAYRQMKAVADQMYDALHADKLQPLYMNGMAQPIFPYTTGEVTEGYSNDESDTVSFADVAADAYYANAAAWAAANGVTAGTSATTFSPDGACTRGQIVRMLYRGDTQA